MSDRVLGLDIGGANLKAANSERFAVVRPFALWRHPEQLTDQLGQLLAMSPPFDRLAVTMTGELCDCYVTKRVGVNAILDAVETAAGKTPISVWRTDGRFGDVASARSEPLAVAAANWLAIASFAGRYVPTGAALLLDIGSTTADIIPISNGRPCPQAFTDSQRLESGELVYTGVRRTPACALLAGDGAAELFATTLDAYLLLAKIAENAADCATADGRPATRTHAHARLARMLCADSETVSHEETRALAERMARRQFELIERAIQRVVTRMPKPPAVLITAGSGEFLAREFLEKQVRNVSLAGMLGTVVSQAAGAYAVAVLAAESTV